MILQVSNRPLESLRLPRNWYLVDMFLSKSHLSSIRDADVILHAIGVLTDAPEGSVFDLSDPEVERFHGIGIAISEHDTDYAAREEMLGSSTGDEET